MTPGRQKHRSLLLRWHPILIKSSLSQIGLLRFGIHLNITSSITNRRRNLSNRTRRTRRRRRRQSIHLPPDIEKAIKYRLWRSRPYPKSHLQENLETSADNIEPLKFKLGLC